MVQYTDNLFIKMPMRMTFAEKEPVPERIMSAETGEWRSLGLPPAGGTVGRLTALVNGAKRTPLREVVIVSVDGVPVDTYGDLAEALGRMRGLSVRIKFEDGRSARARVSHDGDIEFVRGLDTSDWRDLLARAKRDQRDGGRGRRSCGKIGSGTRRS